MAVEIAHVVGVVDMVGPERTVVQLDVLYSDVVAVRDIDESGALFVFVCTLRIPFSSYPKLFPVVVAVAVDGSLSRDGESVEVVGVNEGGEVFACLSFNTCFKYWEVGYVFAALEFSAFLYVEMSALAEKERSAEECAFGYDDYSAAVVSGFVDDCLQCCCLYKGAVGFHSMFCHHIAGSK